MKLPWFMSSSMWTPQGGAKPDVEDLPSLRGPSLRGGSGFQKQEFVDQLNTSGCYIHVISDEKAKIKADFDKIEAHNFPTPATSVGPIPAALYDMGPWQNCSGLIFAPSAVSVLSHKRAFSSCRLQSCKQGLANFKNTDGVNPLISDESYQRYANYLSMTFNSLESAGSSSVTSTSKPLKLKENIEYARSKYRDLWLRENPSELSQTLTVSNSSKFVIADLLRRRSVSISGLTKDKLLKEISDAIQHDRPLGVQLEHAVIKIRCMSSAELQRYLSTASDGFQKSRKKDVYADFADSGKAFPPNEHLLLPTLHEIKGIYVNAKTVQGIDQAFQIKAELEARQTSKGVRRYNHAMLYHPSVTIRKSICNVGWARELLPWSSNGLVEFAKTGHVTASDGKRFVPNYFKHVPPRPIGSKRYRNPDDLSMVKKDGDNLLHIALKEGRSLDVIKFLCFWKVKRGELDRSGCSALGLAKKLRHPAADFLGKLDMVGSTLLNDAEKANFIRSLPIGPR